MRLSGGGEYISVADSEALSFGDGVDDKPFSVEAWIYMNDATDFPIISKGSAYTDAEWFFTVSGASKFDLTVLNNSASAFEKAYYNSALSTGQWYHLCGTYDGRAGASANAGISLYLNGSAVTTTLSDSGTYVAMENLGSPYKIGRYSSDKATGLIDEVRIYSKALSATEILKNYKNGKSAHSN